MATWMWIPTHRSCPCATRILRPRRLPPLRMIPTFYQRVYMSLICGLQGVLYIPVS